MRKKSAPGYTYIQDRLLALANIGVARAGGDRVWPSYRPPKWYLLWESPASLLLRLLRLWRLLGRWWWWLLLRLLLKRPSKHCRLAGRGIPRGVWWHRPMGHGRKHLVLLRITAILWTAVLYGSVGVAGVKGAAERDGRRWRSSQHVRSRATMVREESSGTYRTWYARRNRLMDRDGASITVMRSTSVRRIAVSGVPLISWISLCSLHLVSFACGHFFLFNSATSLLVEFAVAVESGSGSSPRTTTAPTM